NVRYLRDFRSDFAALGHLLIPASGGQRQIPLAQLAEIKTVSGPAMLRDEDGLLTGYVYVDIGGRDPSSYIADAAPRLSADLKLKPGDSVSWSGQYQALERVRKRPTVIVPFTLFVIFLLLYLNTRSVTKSAIVLLAAPFSAVGAVWFLYLLGYNTSVAVWVGLIALLGIDAEMGVFMLLYLDLAYERARRDGSLAPLAGLRAAIRQGAARRLRPKLMTVATMLLGLAPILWSTGTGSDVMKRIAAPMIGGIVTSFVLELVVYPPLYEIWRARGR